MPLIDAIQPEPFVPTRVIFRDPRFMGDVPMLRSEDHTPLTAVVEIDSHNRVVGQIMDGREQK